MTRELVSKSRVKKLLTTCLDIQTCIFYETQSVFGMIVVDPFSSDPGLPNITPVPMDENHISICKPKSPESELYRGIVQFIERILEEKAREEKKREEKEREEKEGEEKEREKKEREVKEREKRVRKEKELEEAKRTFPGRVLYAAGRGWEYYGKRYSAALSYEDTRRREVESFQDIERGTIKSAFRAFDSLYVLPPDGNWTYGSHDIVYVTVRNLRNYVLRREHTILHLSANLSSERNLALRFDTQYSVADLVEDIKASTVKLVLFSKCESLELCSRVFRGTGAVVIAIPTLENASYMNWLEQFYSGLARGDTIQEAHELASGVIGGTWVSLLANKEIKFALQ